MLYAVLALAVGFWLLGQMGGEKGRLRERLETLEELLEKDGPESPLAAANKARSVSALFTREFEVLLQGASAGAASSPQQVAQAMLRYRSSLSRLGVGFRDVKITLSVDERTAEMTAIGTASATTDGGPSRRQFRFSFDWVKEEREWLMRRVELIEELEPGLF